MASVLSAVGCPWLKWGRKKFREARKAGGVTHCDYSHLCFCYLRNKVSKCPMLNSSQHFSRLQITFLVGNAFFQVNSKLFTVSDCGLSFLGLGIMDASNKNYPQLSLKMSSFCPGNALWIRQTAKFPGYFLWHSGNWSRKQHLQWVWAK